MYEGDGWKAYLFSSTEKMNEVADVQTEAIE